MTKLTEETKAKLMRESLAALAAGYMREGQHKKAKSVQTAAQEIDLFPGSLCLLYDAIMQASAKLGN